MTRLDEVTHWEVGGSLQALTCSFSIPRLSHQVSGDYSHPLLPSLLSPSSMASPSPYQAQPFLPVSSLFIIQATPLGIFLNFSEGRC